MVSLFAMLAIGWALAFLILGYEITSNCKSVESTDQNMNKRGIGIIQEIKELVKKEANSPKHEAEILKQLEFLEQFFKM